VFFSMHDGWDLAQRTPEFAAAQLTNGVKLSRRLDELRLVMRAAA
jgi:hypothetical protein